MNAIVSFRKCTLTNEDLIQKVDKAIDNMYESGKIPTRNIPARPNEDFDLTAGELLIRFSELAKGSERMKKSDLEYIKHLVQMAMDDDLKCVETRYNMCANALNVIDKELMCYE